MVHDEQEEYQMNDVNQLKTKIGARLREKRQEKGLSMAVARLIRAEYGVKLDPSYLSRIERGKNEIPLRTLCALADFYQTTVEELVRDASGEKEEESPSSASVSEEPLPQANGARVGEERESRTRAAQ